VSRGAPLGGAAATRVLAQVALRRLLRGKTLWIAALLALCPVVVAGLIDRREPASSWHEAYQFLVVFMVVVPPLLVASAVSDEIEERTYTYLWSRPLPRWSMVVGKLLAGWPVASAILVAAAVASYQVTLGSAAEAPADALTRGVLGCVVGVLGISLIAAGVAALAPGLAQRLTYAYLFVDLLVGELPVSLHDLAVTYHIRQLAAVESPGDTPVGDAIWILAIGGFWLALGLYRLRRAEYSDDR
jgi:hypothetical protein